MAKLNETRADREVAAEPDDEHDQYFAREEVVDDFKHGLFLAVFFLMANLTGSAARHSTPFQRSANGWRLGWPEQFRGLLENVAS
jgi:hypothetical protein